MVAAGISQVAVGALSGWPLAAIVGQPELAEKAGVKDVHRLRQAHVDIIMMGGLIAAAGLVEDSPGWAKTAARIGAWSNPLLFVPLAFRPGAAQSPGYVAATVTSFAITCAGWIGIAHAARGRARSKGNPSTASQRTVDAGALSAVHLSAIKPVSID